MTEYRDPAHAGRVLDLGLRRRAAARPDLSLPLPALGHFGAVISGFAIHHLCLVGASAVCTPRRAVC